MLLANGSSKRAALSASGTSRVRTALQRAFLRYLLLQHSQLCLVFTWSNSGRASEAVCATEKFGDSKWASEKNTFESLARSSYSSIWLKNTAICCKTKKERCSIWKRILRHSTK